MDEKTRITNQLTRAQEGGAWHGPSLRELLADVDPGRASTRAIPGAHTIWELVLHVTVWREAVRRRISGESREFVPEQDWPDPPPPSQDAWRSALEQLEMSAAALRGAVQALPEDRLHEPVATGRGSAYEQVHGLIQHDLYHAGQIAVLKRAAGMGKQV